MNETPPESRQNAHMTVFVHPEKKTLKLYHYAPHGSGDKLVTDPSTFGRNSWSAAERKAEGTPKSFFYVDPKDKEGFFNDRPLYSADYPAEKIYDATGDPEYHTERARSIHDLVTKLRELGYHGMYYSGVFPTVAMWHPVDMQRHEETPTRLARPTVKNHGDIPRIIEDARTYAVAHGAHFGLPTFNPHASQITLDTDRGRLAGAAYDKLTHTPAHPDVAASYAALKRETLAQYLHIHSRGLKASPWVGDPEKYPLADVHADYRANHHNWYFPTSGGFGTATKDPDHPMLEQVPKGTPGVPPDAVFNDLFRIVHDHFGHAQHGHDFSAAGELRAWHEHARLFSSPARRALTTETYGQNSWLHFGPHLRGDETSEQKPYADQKAGILPEDVYPKVRLARGKSFKDIKKSRAYWAFLNKLADGQDSGQSLDQTDAKVFADWLEENGDPRHHVARNAMWHFMHDEHGFPLPHPALPEGNGRGHSWMESVNAPGDIMPLTAYAEGGVPGGAGVSLHARGLDTGHTTRWMESRTVLRLPVLKWSAGIPRTVSTEIGGAVAGSRKPQTREVHMVAPVTADQLHDFIDAMPNSKTKAQFKVAAHTMGWHRSGTETPTKLARNENKVQGTGSAVRGIGTDNHAERMKVVRRILSEAGLQPSTVHAVMSHTDTRGVRPAVAAMIHTDVSPALSRYVGAWLGLMTGERGVTVFHPKDEGEDTLHIISSPFSSSHVGEYLRRSGVPAFTLESHAAGTRAYVVNPLNLIDVPTATKGLNGSNTTLRGTAVRLGAGAGSDADARATYRQVIHDAEQATGSKPAAASPVG